MMLIFLIQLYYRLITNFEGTKVLWYEASSAIINPEIDLYILDGIEHIIDSASEASSISWLNSWTNRVTAGRTVPKWVHTCYDWYAVRFYFIGT